MPRSALRILITLLVMVPMMALTPTQSAEAAAKAKLSFRSESRSVTGPCGAAPFTVSLPQLTGSTAANRAAVAAFAERVPQELTRYMSDPDLCALDWGATPNAVSEGTVYQGRYVSVMTKWRWGEDGGLYILNLDLTTGKTVPLSKLVSDPANLLTQAVCQAFIDQSNWMNADYCPDVEGENPYLGWRVANDGLHMYAWLDDGYFDSVTIAWSKLVRGNYTSSKRRTTKAPSRVIDQCAVVKGVATVTTQGNLVTARNSLRNAVFYGVRGAGEKYGGKWRVLVTWKPYFYGHVYFASKSSTKAIRFDIYSLCGD